MFSLRFEIFYENDCIPRKRKDGIKMKILVLGRFEREDQCVVFFFFCEFAVFRIFRIFLFVGLPAIILSVGPWRIDTTVRSRLFFFFLVFGIASLRKARAGAVAWCRPIWEQVGRARFSRHTRRCHISSAARFTST